MRLRARKIDYVQRLVDTFIVYVAWMGAYFLRFRTDLFGAVPTNSVQAVWYFNFGFLLAVISMIVFKNSKLYSLVRLENIYKEINVQMKAHVFSFVIFLVAAFFLTENRLSRVMLAIYFSISLILLVLSKIAFRARMNNVNNKIVLVGDGQSIKNYYENIKSFKNVEIAYWVDAPIEYANLVKTKAELDLSNIEKQNLDSIIIGYDNENSLKSTTLLKTLSEFIVPIVILPDVSFAKVGFTVAEFKGQPLIYINEPNIKLSGLILKRIFDFVAVLVGGLLISPLLIFLALLVKITSRGPIFYGQTRMGVDGKEFLMWKFRSMVVGDANHQGWTVKDDPRVTPVGKILRKTSLDELPQLWNVIVGDMSLVGPRPERPQYVEKFRGEIPGYMIRHKFKAGITGWAQINGWRGDTSIEKRIECDLWYIKNWSFALDISILFMTFWKGFINKNAY